MYLKLGFLTITCWVCLVAATPQYYDEGYYGQNPSYGQYNHGYYPESDSGYYPEYSDLSARSVKPDKNQGAPNRKQDKGPKPASGQVRPVNGQAYPSNAGAGLPKGQANPQGGLGAPTAGSKPPTGQGYPTNGAGNDYGFDNGAAFPNGPTYSTSGSKKPGFEAHFSDSQSYSGTSGSVNYQTNVKNNFHYVENTERNVYVIPASGGSSQKSGNKNKKDKGFSLW